jgi:hypothetical protein
MELPANFEIGYADEDFFYSIDVTFISAGGITTSIDFIGVTASVIEWLNLC